MFKQVQEANSLSRNLEKSGPALTKISNLILTPLAAVMPLRASLQHPAPCHHNRRPAITPQCSTAVLSAPSSSHPAIPNPCNA